MKNIETPSQNISITEQRELLQEKYPDTLYGVYQITHYDDTPNGNIELLLKENLLTAYKNKSDAMDIPDSCQDMTILDLSSLRKGEIQKMSGPSLQEKDVKNLVLLSNGVLDYIKGSTGKKHYITTQRDAENTDELKRTGPAGRNEGFDLVEEALKEVFQEAPFLGSYNEAPLLVAYDEAPFLGTNEKGEYTLCIPEGSKEGWEYTKNSIKDFLKNKYTLSRENPKDVPFIAKFERVFSGIRYEELGGILQNIIDTDKYVSYSHKKGNIEGLESEIRNIILRNEKGEENSIATYVFYDKNNNTIEYRLIQEITGFPEGFKTVGKIGRLYLESSIQAPGAPRIENTADPRKYVPTYTHVAKRVRDVKKNIEEILDGTH